MPEKLLISLLMKLSETLASLGIKQAQDEILNLFCQVLQADSCAVYLAKESNFYLYKHCSVSGAVEMPSSLDFNGLTLSGPALYMNEPQKSGCFFPGELGRCLLLPLRKYDKLRGIILTGWKNHSPLDHPDQDSMRLFLPISQILIDVYCSPALFQSLKQREKSLMALYQKAERELENSRRQVSLELHDEVGQVLTSILLQLKLLQQSEDLEYIKGRLGGLHYITMQTIEEVRRISSNLRPTLLEKIGLQAALEAHIQEFMDSTAITVEFRRANVEGRLPNHIEIIIYRAVQEGLTNVARHAQASEVLVNLAAKGNNLLLQISDNGKGKADEEHHGLGLLGIKERVNLARGKFWLVNQAGKGLSLNLLLPLDKHERELNGDG